MIILEGTDKFTIAVSVNDDGNRDVIISMKGEDRVLYLSYPRSDEFLIGLNHVIATREQSFSKHYCMNFNDSIQYLIDSMSIEPSQYRKA